MFTFYLFILLKKLILCCNTCLSSRFILAI